MMDDVYLVSGLRAELRAKGNSRDYHRELLKQDPFNWSLKLTVEALDAEVQELRKAVCLTDMQQCG